MGKEIWVIIRHSLGLEIQSELVFVTKQEFNKTGATMRQISDAALAKILETEGTDPITLVQIFWDEQQSIIYGDRAFLPEIKGQLLDLGEIENVINASAGSNSGSVSIRLNDTDGSLKTIMDKMDIHKRPVYILQWFPQIPLKDAFIVFDGVISSPIIWKEGERTLSFDVISKIEDLEVGYSAEEGNFEYIPPNMVGQAWPMVFGSVIHLPAIQINEIPFGNTLDDTGIDGAGEGQGPLKDYGETERKNITVLMELERQCFTMAAILLGNAMLLDAETMGGSAGLTGGGTLVEQGGLSSGFGNFASKFGGFPGADPNDSFTVGGFTTSGAVARISDNPQAQQLYDAGTEYERMRNEYLQERMRPINSGVFGNPNNQALEKNQVRINGGSKFPQGQRVIVHINGAPHEGYFEGEIFTIVSRTHPYTDQNAVVGPTEVLDRAVATEYKTTLGVQTFFYAIAGSTVNIAMTSYPVYYLVGIPHLTNITVLARKEGKGLTKFVVPTSYYAVNYVQFGDLKATIVAMSRPLSSRGEGWEDEVFVNCKSPIGPNAVEIMKYLITHYTNQSYDEASFEIAKTHVNPYKANFALMDRRGALDVLQEIAYQSRCSLWFKGGRFYIKYLPVEGTVVDTIVEADVESGTMEVFSTETEDVVTKWSITWKPRVDQEPPNKIVYRYHIAKYGLIEEDYDCYIYNNVESVKKFALFWLIRKANTWKKIRFSTFMTKLRLEPFDTVLINFAYPWVNDPGCVKPTLGVVEKAAYDSESQRIQMEIWLPIRLGEMCPYDFAYPGNVDTTLIFPQENDPGINTDVPGAQAPGQLYDQSTQTGPTGTPNWTPPNFGTGGGVSVSDHNDQAASDAGQYNPPTSVSAGDMNNTRPPPGAPGAPASTQEVSQRTIKPINLTVKDVPDAAFPGIIKGRPTDASGLHLVDVYFSGLSKPPKQMLVKQIKIAEGDKIPLDTPCLVLRNSLRNADGMLASIEYTMQVPIWLKPDETDPGQSPLIPPSDPGIAPGDERPTEVPPQADEGDMNLGPEEAPG